MVNHLTFPILLVILLLACLISSTWIYHLEWSLSFNQLWQNPHELPIDALIFQNNTLPRMLMAILVGAALALSTTLLQQIMRNPLASDSTLAVSSGAQTALLITTIFLPQALHMGAALIAFIGASIALGIVLWLSLKRSLEPLIVVLAGLVMSLYLGALSSLLMLFFSEEVRGIMQWGAGSLIQDSWHDTLHITAALLIVMMGILIIAKPLSIMQLSDEHAIALGIPIKPIRLIALLLAALLAAIVVADVGMMGFIGLAAASITQALGIRRLLPRMVIAALIGALILWLTDNLLILLNHYQQIDLPAGSVTALIGAPLLLWLMRHTRAHPASQHQQQTLPKERHYLLPSLLILALLVIMAALFIGHGNTGWDWQSLPDILALRAPRTLIAAAGGIMLAVCGVILQRLTRNPMASPELLGISSGTALGVLLALWLGNIAPNTPLFWLIGIIAALLTLATLFYLNLKNGLMPEKILLTGIALAALSDAFIRVWSASGDFRIQQMMIWLSGSTYAANPISSSLLLIAAGIVLASAHPLSRWLSLFSLGDSVAQSVGVPINPARFSLILLSGIATALATLSIGPLSFVGLIAPHLAYLLGARQSKTQLSASALIAIIIMVLADWLGRQIGYPYEIPAGIIATLIGGGYFLLIMRKL